MKNGQLRIAVIKGDGIGVDVTNATLAVIAAAERYGLEAHANAARMIETAIQTGFAQWSSAVIRVPSRLPER